MIRLFLFLSLSLVAASAVARQKVPVILVAGQSNADGRVPMADFPQDIVYKYCRWSYGSGNFETVDGTFAPYSPRVAKPGIERSWGFDAVVYHLLEQRWQRPFYVIKQTMGGTAIDTSCVRSTNGWFWSLDAGEKSLLKAFCRQIDDCLRRLPKNSEFQCLIWHQGESDQPAADRYYDNLKTVIAYIRQHLAEVTGDARYASLPVICGTYAKQSRQRSSKVVEALYRLQGEDDNFHVVDAADLSLLSDRLHFDARGALTLGRRVFDRMMRRSVDVWPVTDPAVKKSLNGEWQLKVIEGIDDHSEGVPEADESWSRIPVPGCWEAYGFCRPKYNFPDSLTGYYRTTFTVPAEWKGQQVMIRLDGVLRGYDLWLNNQYVGTWESGYNTCLFDLTPYLTERAFRGEPQQLAMRVYSQFKGYEFDCFDDWATMGIFRDVTLFAVPETHLSNLTVMTKMDGKVTVKAEVANATKNTTTAYEIYDAEGRLVSTGEKIVNSLLWTAETPYLYTLKVYVKDKKRTLQTFTQKIGIREISVDGNILKVNGSPVKLRGVNVHSTDPATVKVISDDLTLKDMRMMKEASVNYMRLSHYPREPRFYELADSLGFYLVDEVPFGFGDKHLSDRSYQDILKTRALATVTRDKNHPSVIVWSVGNENPLPQTCVEVGDYVGQLDPSRPYCFPQVGSYFRHFWDNSKNNAAANSSLFTLHSSLNNAFPSKAPVYAPHYPTTDQLGGFYQHLDRPVVFTEYCHTLGISFEDHDRQWEIIERTPGLAGGAVWEWADQGVSFTQRNDGGKWRTDGAERDQRVYTHKDVGFEMNGNYGADGLLYADRTPLPNYYELQHNYARAFVRSVCCCDTATDLTIANRYDFLNLKGNVTFRWYLTADRDTVARGSFSPDCAPRASVPYTLVLPALQQNRLALLQFDLTDGDGHTFLHQSFVLQKPAVQWTGTDSPMSCVQEQTVRTGRKLTMAERKTQREQMIPRYLLPMDNRQVKADVQTTQIDGGQEVAFTLTPDTTDVFRAELGLAYLLTPEIDRVQWVGYGPFAGYPGRHQANRYGIWSKHMDDLYFEGNHNGVDAAFFSDKDGNGLLVVGDSLDINFEQTDRGIVMTVNAAVSGQGPKFAKTAFPGWKRGDAPVSASFRLYRIEGRQMPQAVRNLFLPASQVPAPFKPFLTQYDTYLLRYTNIKEK